MVMREVGTMTEGSREERMEKGRERWKMVT
jgi:hypothetical protein